MDGRRSPVDCAIVSEFWRVTNLHSNGISGITASTKSQSVGSDLIGGVRRGMGFHPTPRGTHGYARTNHRQT